MSTNPTLIPIYTTRGDCSAFLIYPYIFNRQGEWIGWVEADRQVYSVHGQHIGWLNRDSRILRKRSGEATKPRRNPPLMPQRIRVPASTPLAPLMAELSYDTIDVLEEDPELLPTADYGEKRLDMD